MYDNKDSNRTFMELKLCGVYFFCCTIPKLQSHLYGIEIIILLNKNLRLLDSNRTFMELKLFL